MWFCIFSKYIHNIQFHWKIADASKIYSKSQLEGFLYLFFQVTLRYWELCDYLKIQRYCNDQAKRVKETPLLWHYWFFSIIKMLLWIYLYCKTTFASWYAKTNNTYDWKIFITYPIFLIFTVFILLMLLALKVLSGFLYILMNSN